jgi:phage tail sheath protein FI
MPVQVGYPGVYIEELPSGVRTITGVATSIGAFVDNFAAGPMNKAVQIFSFADFDRVFGGLDQASEASYAIQQFFLNGGAQAYVVRVSSPTTGKGAVEAAIALEDRASGSKVLTVTAESPGKWGNNVLIDVDYDTTDPATQFNLTATETITDNGTTRVVATERFRNLVLDTSKTNDALAVVNSGSTLIRLSKAAANTRPAQTGTVSAVITDVNSLGLADTQTMDVSLSSKALGTTAVLGKPPTTLGALASTLQGLLRGVADTTTKKAFLPNATVTVIGSSATQAWLVARAGTGNPADFLALSDSGTALASRLGFNKNVDAQNVQHYALGGAAAQAQAVPDSNQQRGTDGAWDPASDADGMTKGLIGDAVAKTGMYALMNVDLFNILCIPTTMNLPDSNAAAVAAQAIDLCTNRRAMYLLDVPKADDTRDTVDAIRTWLDTYASLRSRNAALYFPRVDIPDPLAGYRLRKVAPSGSVAGLYARIDGTRGVWKAPAGTEASLTGVQKLEYRLTDPENGVLNPLAINCLRVFPVYGPVCWGARTLYGSDQLSDDYKYVPIRRLALYIEESLFRGTQWAVFEKNDAPLWRQLSLNIGAFMQTLFRQGAFQGATPADAYYVQCDATNNPQSSINLGIVTVTVGFAPLKPAEFVIIQIQQMAGQIAI